MRSEEGMAELLPEQVLKWLGELPLVIVQDNLLCDVNLNPIHTESLS